MTGLLLGLELDHVELDSSTILVTPAHRCLDNTHFGARIGAIVVVGGRRGPMVKDGRKILFFTKIILQKEMTLRSNK